MHSPVFSFWSAISCSGELLHGSLVGVHGAWRLTWIIQMINRLKQRCHIITPSTWLQVPVCAYVQVHSHPSPQPVPRWLMPHMSLSILPACIAWHLPLKVKCYFRSEVTINMAKIISFSIPCGPETENNFPFSLASADSGENEDIQPPGPAACSR